MQGSASRVPSERIQKAIFLIRGQKVMLDKDLAELYVVSTSVLNKAVTRNIDRFPPDFMFRLTSEEFSDLKFHFGTSSWGGTRKRPRADPAPFSGVLSHRIHVFLKYSVDFRLPPFSLGFKIFQDIGIQPDGG